VSNIEFEVKKPQGIAIEEPREPSRKEEILFVARRARSEGPGGTEDNRSI